MNKHSQKIFWRLVVDRMRDDLRSGSSLETYFKNVYVVEEADCLVSTVEAYGEMPVLSAPPNDPVSADLDNAIVLHKYFPKLDETQASDARLWVYLSHVEFRQYTLIRWGLDGAYSDLADDESKQKAINYIFEHWFTGGNIRDLRRHSIARLWWAAHLTYAPWENDLEFFGQLKNDDPYFYTRILFRTQDIYQSVLERRMGRSDKILILILDYLGKHSEFSESREKIRGLIKELNLILGVRNLISLGPKEIAEIIERTANDVVTELINNDAE